MQGRIIKQISNSYTVLSDKEYICGVRGKFRNLHITPLVGDLVNFDPNELIIDEIFSRKTELTRPTIANIDQAIIVTSVKHPDFSPILLDKLLVMVSYANVKPIICFTKLDLLNEQEKNVIDDYRHYYEDIGYIVLYNTELDRIKKLFNNKITVLAGQSGAGKSSLLNRIDANLNLQTDEISEALNRGKHTTRHVELLQLYNGLVADTPGFSSIDLNMNKEDIRDAFIEFNKYKEKCEYRDCMHLNEQKCEVKKMVVEHKILQSRYDSYLKLIGK